MRSREPRWHRTSKAVAWVFIGGFLIAAALNWWTRPHMIESGGALAVVESREINTGFFRWKGTEFDWGSFGEIGTGIAGTVGLIRGDCVGFVGGDPNEGTLIVWPPGTSIEGSGDDIRITSEGRTIRIGEEIEAGADLRRQFPELDRVIPAECQGLDMIPVGLSS